jgi:alpha-L-fucosidase
MKRACAFLLLLALAIPVTLSGARKSDKAVWGPLMERGVPQWARDAKFGIYAHWGVYSVSGQWDYAEPNWGNGYICAYKGFYSTNAKNDQRKQFEKNIGPVEEGYGYKDLAGRFKAEKFDPEYWADLIVRSGAKYAGICAIHHDGYAMWDSDVVDYCAGKLGPERDLLGEILSAVEDRGLKTFTSFHHARTYKHFRGITRRLRQDASMAKADLLDPDLRNLYWFAGEEEHFSEIRHQLTMEVIDKYTPDAIWFDGGGGKYGTEFLLSHYFEVGDAAGKEVVVHNKGNFPEQFGVYSYENGHARPLYVDWPWEDDTPSANGWCDWPWFKAIEYKQPRDIVVRLCDLVARNGGLLLSLNPRPDGTLDKGQVDLLEGIGGWLRQNGEAIYATVPWKIFAEGNTGRLEYHQYKEDGTPSRAIQPDPERLDWQDVRFTRNGENLYATVLGISPNGMVAIKSLSSKTTVSESNRITSVYLLGHGLVEWERTDKALEIQLPQNLPNAWALAFRVTVAGELDKSKPDIDGTRMKLPQQT